MIWLGAAAVGVLCALAVLGLGGWLASRRRPELVAAGDGARSQAPTPGPPPGAHRDGLPTPAIHVEPAGSPRLPKFADVGGEEALKQDMRDTVGLLLTHAKEADRYRISWNGILLHGPPGTGKSFLARAMAGEFGLSFVHVATSDLVTPTVGGGPERILAAFQVALDHLPCVLFFDEFDAVAGDRGEAQDGGHGRELLTQLLQSLEEHHEDHRLLVMAATNDVSSLDPAVTRPGRFDRIVRLDLPDAATRQAIFAAALSGRPCGALDLETCARRTKGLTAAAIVRLVDAAALAAFRQNVGSGRTTRISMHHLDEALEHRGGTDRPTVEDWNWERLVLPAATQAELRQIQSLIEDPDRSAQLGVDPPSGVLLTGPPGTGKTTIAKVLAAESACSFYPVSGADVTSRWVGDSEKAIARLFLRARDNAPSIIFIDEIDAIASSRGELQAYDRQLDQLLQEMDGLAGQQGVTVLAATNRKRDLDPAILRGGRLSRVIDIPRPDADARLAILNLLTARMPLDGVDLEDVAVETEGLSGADLKGLCQQAAMESLIRADGADSPARAHRGGGEKARTHPGRAATVTGDDFRRALTELTGDARPLRARRRVD